MVYNLTKEENPLIVDYYEQTDQRFLSRYGYDKANWPKEVLNDESS